MLQIAEKQIIIMGIKGSGKTELAKTLIKKYNSPLIYEVHPEFRDIQKALIYSPKDLSVETLESFCMKVKSLALKKEIDSFFIDESDMFFSHGLDSYPNMKDLVINHRHYGLALIFITRRPQDLPSQIIENAHINFIFIVEGDNVISKLKGLNRNIPELIKSLSLERHNFILKEIGKEAVISAPIIIN